MKYRFILRLSCNLVSVVNVYVITVAALTVGIFWSEESGEGGTT